VGGGVRSRLVDLARKLSEVSPGSRGCCLDFNLGLPDNESINMTDLRKLPNKSSSRIPKRRLKIALLMLFLLCELVFSLEGPIGQASLRLWGPPVLFFCVLTLYKRIRHS
jgi:hypothetical protein